MNARPLELLVTLWPSLPYFERYSHDARVMGGIRLNSAMLGLSDLDRELEIIRAVRPRAPLFFDVKGRQMRVVEATVSETDHHLEIVLNHPIQVETPVPVLFKSSIGCAILDHLEEDGRRLVFRDAPDDNYLVHAGESIHIRHPSLRVLGPIFTDLEKEKIAKVHAAGCTRWFLSYVESARDLDEFQELVGRDAELRLKIESQNGMRYVANEFRKRDNVSLVAARGDLYVEVERPHEIARFTKEIIAADPEATVGSRLLLSTLESPVPSCADFSELAWLYDIGYRRMMLCDEMCLREDLLSRAVDAFDQFREHYTSK